MGEFYWLEVRVRERRTFLVSGKVLKYGIFSCIHLHICGVPEPSGISSALPVVVPSHPFKQFSSPQPGPQKPSHCSWCGTGRSTSIGRVSEAAAPCLYLRSVIRPDISWWAIDICLVLCYCHCHLSNDIKERASFCREE